MWKCDAVAFVALILFRLSEYADVAAYFSLTQAQMFEMAAGAIDLIFDEAYKVKLREIFAAARASQLD